MTFTGRLRLALVLAAIFPTVLISIIVMVGLSQQAKRIEHRDAEAACRRFVELLDNTSGRISQNLKYIADSREFQMMEWGLEAQRRPDPKYRLPLLSLDFVEYADVEGLIMISADRPALMGEIIDYSIAATRAGQGRFVYENDLNGTHPSLALSLPTESGYIRGGIFLDGVFGDLVSAVTRSNLVFVDLRDTRPSGEPSSPPSAVGQPYRSGDDLYAVLAYQPEDEFYPAARFMAYEARELFTDFLTAIIVVTIVSLLLVIPAGLYFSARTRREFDLLTGGAVRVAAGDFSRPVDTSGEGEFADLAESFNRMMRQLTDYREKLIMSQKIAAWQSIGRKIAHEVKNPLTPIAIAIDDLKDSYRTRPDDYGRILDECSTTIKGEVNRLKKLIDQFSTFAKMPPPEFLRVSSEDFVRDIAVLFKDEIDKGRLVIERDSGVSIVLDPEQMRQVVINLVKNSFEAECRRCVLRITANDERVMLAVEDDGPGIPARIIEDGPVPYFSTKEHGHGLGLIICQRIVFDHDGMMNIENKPDGGARVVITLPREHAQNTTHR